MSAVRKNELVKIEDQVPKVLQKARNFVIESHEGINVAKEEINLIKKMKEYFNNLYNQRIDEAYKHHRALIADKNSFINPLDEAESIYKREIGMQLDREEEEARKEAERRAEEIRKEKEKAIEKINKRIGSLEEKQLSVQEEIGELEKMLDYPETSEDEARVIRARIEALESKKMVIEEKIEDQQERAEEVKMPDPREVEQKPLRVEGIRQRKVLEPHVEDKMKVIRAVAEGNIPDSVIKLEMSVIKMFINKGMEIPGIKGIPKRDTRIYGK